MLRFWAAFAACGALLVNGANTVSSDSTDSIVLSGDNNRISDDADNSVIGGGSYNVLQGTYGGILSGAQNVALSNFATILGGFSNKATGRFATVLGGAQNSANGRWSLAAGFKAKAKAENSVAMGFSGDVCEVANPRVFKICADRVELVTPAGVTNPIMHNGQPFGGAAGLTDSDVRAIVVEEQANVAGVGLHDYIQSMIQEFFDANGIASGPAGPAANDGCGANCASCNDQGCVVCDTPEIGNFVVVGDHCELGCPATHSTTDNTVNGATCAELLLLSQAQPASSPSLYSNEKWQASNAVLPHGDSAIGLGCNWDGVQDGSVAISGGGPRRWQVELASDYDVVTVGYRGMGNLGGEYYANTQVMVCPSADSDSIADCSWCEGPISPPQGGWAEVSCSAIGRFVRLEVDMAKNWHFCRVTVSGIVPTAAGVGGGRTAEGKVARVISTGMLTTSSGNFPYFGRDDVADDQWSANNAFLDHSEATLGSQCTWASPTWPGHTGSVAIDNEPGTPGAGARKFVQVDLQNEYRIERVEFRGMDNLETSKYTANTQFLVCPGRSSSDDDCTPCGGPVTPPTGGWIEISCTSAPGQFVRLTWSTSAGINWHFCRVAVWGVPAADDDKHKPWPPQYNTRAISLNKPVTSSMIYPSCTYNCRWGGYWATANYEESSIASSCNWDGSTDGNIAITNEAGSPDAGGRRFVQIDLESVHRVHYFQYRAASTLPGDPYSKDTQFMVCPTADAGDNACTNCGAPVTPEGAAGWVTAECPAALGRYARAVWSAGVGTNWHFCRIVAFGIPAPGQDWQPDYTPRVVSTNKPVTGSSAYPSCTASDCKWGAQNAVLNPEESSIGAQCNWDGATGTQVAIHNEANSPNPGGRRFVQIDLQSNYRIDSVGYRGVNNLPARYWSDARHMVCPEADTADSACTPCGGPATPAGPAAWISTPCNRAVGRYLRTLWSRGTLENWHFCRIAVYAVPANDLGIWP